MRFKVDFIYFNWVWDDFRTGFNGVFIGFWCVQWGFMGSQLVDGNLSDIMEFYDNVQPTLNAEIMYR